MELMAAALSAPRGSDFPKAELVDQKWILLGAVAASSALAFTYKYRFGSKTLPVAFF
jgi:hypothetical protein